MTFSAAIASVFRQYATFSGRARRAEYWWFVLFQVLVSIGVAILNALLLIGTEEPGVVGVVGLLVPLALLLPGLAVSVRRLHDTNRPGWWLPILFVPLAGVIVMLVFTLSDSDRGPNRYGPSPKYQAPPPGYPAPGGYPQQA